VQLKNVLVVDAHGGKWGRGKNQWGETGEEMGHRQRVTDLEYFRPGFGRGEGTEQGCPRGWRRLLRNGEKEEKEEKGAFYHGGLSRGDTNISS